MAETAIMKHVRLLVTEWEDQRIMMRALARLLGLSLEITEYRFRCRLESSSLAWQELYEMICLSGCL